MGGGLGGLLKGPRGQAGGLPAERDWGKLLPGSKDLHRDLCPKSAGGKSFESEVSKVPLLEQSMVLNITM